MEKLISDNKCSKNRMGRMHLIITYSILAIQICYPIKALIPSYLIIPLYCCWFIMSSIKNERFISKVIINTSFILVFIFLTILKLGLGNNFTMGFFSPVNLIISAFNLFMYYSMYIYIKDLQIGTQRKIIQVSLSYLIISILPSLYYVTYLDPDSIRYAKYDKFFGVGDFELIYSLVFLVSYITIYLLRRLNRKKIKEDRKLFITYILSVLLILKANYMTAILLMIYAILISITIGKKVNKILLVSIHVIGAIGVLFLREPIASVIYKVSEGSFWSGIIQNKLIAVGNLLLGHGELDTFSNRSNLIKKSMESFFNNPLFGISFSNHNNMTIGAHSAWPDTLGRYGIIGTIVLLIGIFQIIRYMYKSSTDLMQKNNIIVSWIIFFVLGFFNPNMMSCVLVMIFIIGPFISKIDVKERSIKNVSPNISDNSSL